MRDFTKNKLVYILFKLAWSNWEEASDSGIDISTYLQAITTELDLDLDGGQISPVAQHVLSILSKSGITQIIGDKIIIKKELAPIDEHILPEIAISETRYFTTQSIIDIIRKYTPENLVDCVYNLLFESHIISEADSGHSTILFDRDRLLDQVLTVIEKADSKQIEYGIYETEQTAKELLEHPPIEGDFLRIQTRYAIRELLKDGYLLPFNISGDIVTWTFRSRIAETVRLLEQLKQRFNTTSDSDAVRLVKSIKFEVKDRKYPKRFIPIKRAIQGLCEIALQLGQYSETEIQYSSRILTDALVNKYGESFVVSAYQNRSFQTVFENLITKKTSSHGFVLTAGTGMGKTLSYQVPLLFYCILDRKNHGVKAINIYPRVKLSENQFTGFSGLLWNINKHLPVDEKITIGIDYQGTPYKLSDFTQPKDMNQLTLRSKSIDRKWVHEFGKGYSCPYFKCPKCGRKTIGVAYGPSEGTPLKCWDCGEEIDWIQYTKETQANNPPNILIITTEMLNKHLRKAASQSLFGDRTFTAPKLIMVDEIHLHTSLVGSNTALLLRRLLARINLGIANGAPSNGLPYVVGLSATIGEPVTFFSELSGVDEERIVHEQPLPDELEKNGAEYYIFVKPDKSQDAAITSTLLQTCMCVLHTMPKIRGEDNTQEFYKTLGFVDSLDIVKRWNKDLSDAESKQLFQLRNPQSIKRDKKLQNFVKSKITVPYNCDACKNGINRFCPLYKNGECWWFMCYGEKTQNKERSLKIKFNTAAESIDLDKPYDLLVTTSAMEVGYDDPNIMCIVQYQTPSNMASFSQRKGRAGRSLRNRPITITVFNPYNTRDLYYYQNHHYFTEPSFEKPPLNIENQSIKQIHGFYSIFDRIAFFNHCYPRLVGEEFPGAYTLKRNNQLETEISTLRFYGIDNEYTLNIIGYSSKSLLNVLSEKFYLIIDTLETRENCQKLAYITLEQMLPTFLPKNLFSSLNLPAVNVCDYYPTNIFTKSNAEWLRYKKGHACPYDVDDISQFIQMHKNGVCNRKLFATSFVKCGDDNTCKLNYLESDVDINLGISNSFVGKATQRYIGSSYWVPPILETNNGQSQFCIDNYYLQLPDNKEKEEYNAFIKTHSIPYTLKSYVPQITENNPLHLFRPDIIRARQFQEADSGVSNWFYPEELHKVTPSFEIEGEKPYNSNITDKSKAYPVSFYTTELVDNETKQPLQPILLSTKPAESSFEHDARFGPFGELVSDITFANADTSSYINAKHAIVGGNGALYFYKGKHDFVPLNFSFNHHYHNAFGDQLSEDVALGYELYAEGVKLSLNYDYLVKEIPRITKETKSLYKDLLSNIFKESVFLKNRGPDGFNSFTLSTFLDTYLHFCHQEGYTAAKLLSLVSNETMRIELLEKIKDENIKLGVSNSFSISELESIFSDANRAKSFLLPIATAQEDILEEKNEELVNKRIIDVFVHSFKHALKSASLTLGGFEREWDVTGWCEMSYDFDTPTSDIYVFEQGMYGNGGFRSIYQKYIKSPLSFWNHLLYTIENCPTAHNESLLRTLLAKSDDFCEKIAYLIETLLQTPGTTARNSIISTIIEFIRANGNLFVTAEDISQIIRVFTPPLEIEGMGISNWKLFKELNIVAWETLSEKFNRTPTTIELIDYCESNIKNQSIFSEWKKLLELITQNSNNDMTLVKKRLNAEIEKHLLNTCVDGCPACLHTACNLDSNPKSKHLMLSRRLLQLVVSQIKHNITSTDIPFTNVMLDVQTSLKNHYWAYLKYAKTNAKEIGQLISDMINWEFTINGKQYVAYVHSDHYVSEDKMNAEPMYELCISLKEVRV